MNSFFKSILFSLLITLAACTPGGEVSQQLKVFTWNVHNLFDDVSNGNEYPEFVPGSQWNTPQMWARMEKIAQVIKESSSEYPDVVALQEVENQNTLELLRDRFLQGIYPYLIFKKTPGNGVGLGVLSRLPIIRVGVLEPPQISGEVLRPLLEVEVKTGAQSVILINNHWKSRQPSPESTEIYRRASAKVLLDRIKCLQESRPGVLIIALGDFNFSFENQSKTKPHGLEQNDLDDLWARSPDPGSYFYKGKWERLDHIFLPLGWESSTGWLLDKIETVKLPWAVNKGGEPRGWSPRDPLGVSDHLPLQGHFHRLAPRQEPVYALK